MLNNALSSCQSFVFEQLLENWANYGINTKYGFSYESMNHDWSVNSVGRLRLLTQCRQLYTFSRASQIQTKPVWQAKLQPLFNFITSYFFKEGRWIFSLNEDLSVQQSQTDTYTLAFVLLSFSHYYQVTQNKEALSYIDKTHRFLISNMQATTGGFYESYPIDTNQTRRQNPHMHLLEGYIAAYNTTKNEDYKKALNLILPLIKERFYDKKTGTLREFFYSDWTIESRIGHQVEPGHHFEWVWLLHEAYKITPDTKLTDLAQNLWITATRHGMAVNGGIYNQIDGDTYQAIDKAKRIWPITEYLKAITAIPIERNEKVRRIESALSFLNDHYFQENGVWNEYLNEDNSPRNYPLPGTSSYHIFLGLVEVIRWNNTTKE